MPLKGGNEVSSKETLKVTSQDTLGSGKNEKEAKETGNQKADKKETRKLVRSDKKALREKELKIKAAEVDQAEMLLEQAYGTPKDKKDVEKGNPEKEEPTAKEIKRTDIKNVVQTYKHAKRLGRSSMKEDKTDIRAQQKQEEEGLKQQLEEGEIDTKQFKEAKRESKKLMQQNIQEETQEFRDQKREDRETMRAQRFEIRQEYKQAKRNLKNPLVNSNFSLSDVLSGADYFGSVTPENLDGTYINLQNETIKGLQGELDAIKSDFNVVEMGSREKVSPSSVTKESFQKQFGVKGMEQGLDIKDSSVVSDFFYDMYTKNQGKGPSEIAQYILDNIGETLSKVEYVNKENGDNTQLISRMIGFVENKYGNSKDIFTQLLRDEDTIVLNKRRRAGEKSKSNSDGTGEIYYPINAPEKYEEMNYETLYNDVSDLKKERGAFKFTSKLDQYINLKKDLTAPVNPLETLGG